MHATMRDAPEKVALDRINDSLSFHSDVQAQLRNQFRSQSVELGYGSSMRALSSH